MQISSTAVALQRCGEYQSRMLTDHLAKIWSVAGPKVNNSTRVLLKPNLLTGRSRDHLACTNPIFVAAVAAWLIDQGAKVSIGDSPAFGSAIGVMRMTGIVEALAGMEVTFKNFDRSVPVRLPGGVTVKIASDALECDMLVNLPRVKAHSQMYMTLAVKNYFGTVVGFQKPWWHLRYGNHAARFASHLVDVLTVLPDGITLVDGIIAMHETGPISGSPFALGVLAGGINPVAIDTAFLKILGLDHAKSALWQEYVRRGLVGADADTLDYPLLSPEAFSVSDFKAPALLKPVSFNPLRMLVSAVRRLVARLKEST